MAKYKTMLEYAKSQDEFECDIEDCAWYYDGINGNCNLESCDECPFRELFLQVQEESKGNLSHIPEVVSPAEPSFTEITHAENEAYEQAGHNAYFGNGFRAGAKWMFNWMKARAGSVVKTTD